MSIRQKKIFKVTQGHLNRHRGISYLWLSINVP